MPMTSFDLTALPSKECRNFIARRPIDAYKRFSSSSLKVEGWRGDGVGDYCYAYDFEIIYIRRPDNTPCDVSVSWPVLTTVAKILSFHRTNVTRRCRLPSNLRTVALKRKSVSTWYEK